VSFMADRYSRVVVPTKLVLKKVEVVFAADSEIECSISQAQTIITTMNIKRIVVFFFVYSH
ncbi:MAG: hypothetical protein ACPG32_08600, partial [Akkermansiaceae bacterium]